MKLYGKNPVLERLKSNPKSIQKIFIEEHHVEAGYIYTKAKKWGIPVVAVPRSQMLKLAKTVNAQGIMVEIDDFSYSSYEDLLEAAVQSNGTIIFLDNLSDPQNLGAIIRTAACFGGFSIVLPARESVEVTEAVLRVASGGDNYIAVAKVGNLHQALTKAKEAGFWVAGTVVEGGQRLENTSFSFPLALVIGSEQKGIRDIIKKQLDLQLTIGMANAKLSFNAAQAATIFCYEIARQKYKKK